MLRLTQPEAATVRAGWLHAVKERAQIQALATAIGVKRQYLSRVLNEKTETIPATTYLAICEHLGIDPNEHIESKATLPWEP